MKHFEDREIICQFCNQTINIKHNQVGGVWTLNGWDNVEGEKVYGQVCSPCFGEMIAEKKKRRMKHLSEEV